MEVIPSTLLHSSILSNVDKVCSIRSKASIHSTNMYPVHSLEKLEILQNELIASGKANSNSFSRTAYSIANSILSSSSHVSGTLGSPGTYLVYPLNSSDNKYEAIIVNELGDETLHSLTRVLGGWKLDKDESIYRSLEELNQKFFSGLESTLGLGSYGIPFLSFDQIESVIAKLSQEESGTYVCFAHLPANEANENSELLSPVKRNIVLWKTEDGFIEQAHFHFDPRICMWLNGGPCINPRSLEEILSSTTLAGLIEKKIELSSRGVVYCKPMSLEAI